MFGGFTGLGILLSSRLGGSPFVPIIVLAIVGAYAGWLVGVIVFGAVRGASTAEEKS